MKGYYLFAPMERENTGPASGVERKVRAQHRALCQSLDCELVVLPPVEYTGSIAEKIRRRLPFTAAWRKWKYRGEFNDADFLYIRQVYHDASFVRWLRSLRRQNPAVKIVYEVPTYPYDQQGPRSLSAAPLRIKERINRRRVAKLVDRIVTFYGQDRIWNVLCIPLMNGFDFSLVSLSDRILRPEIHIVSVAQSAFWHGYQYMLEGLRDYYAAGGGENIIYHMVGNILPQYEKIVQQYHLQEHVIFHGRLAGQALFDVYKSCSLGLNVLGEPADGNPKSSSLKSREYGAVGLPIVSALPIDYLPEDYPYLCLLPPVNEPVEISKIIRFYHHIYDNGDPDLVAQTIRDYAKAHCDMTVTMQPVVDWVRSTKGT
ncbi:MAG: hypothetical protein IJK24_07995 [Oscillospiraceae bacterium]|nr:hypothetical protein [Oscillospiraceae bacterium]